MACSIPACGTALVPDGAFSGASPVFSSSSSVGMVAHYNLPKQNAITSSHLGNQMHVHPNLVAGPVLKSVSLHFKAAHVSSEVG